MSYKPKEVNVPTKRFIHFLTVTIKKKGITHEDIAIKMGLTLTNPYMYIYGLRK